jgi:L-asparaginase
MKNILVVFTGGTFSKMIDKKTGGAVPRFSGRELLRKIPEAKKLANITCHDFGKYPGPHVTPDHVCSQIIKNSFRKKKFEGVIVIHGTNAKQFTYLI